MFSVSATRLGYDTSPPPLSTTSFRRLTSGPQLGLFD